MGGLRFDVCDGVVEEEGNDMEMAAGRGEVEGIGILIVAFPPEGVCTCSEGVVGCPKKAMLCCPEEGGAGTWVVFSLLSSWTLWR